MHVSERTIRILTGLIAITTFIGVASIGVAAGNGSLTPKYHLFGKFTAAGQGLVVGSDVKIRGVNVGQVSSIRLLDGRARVGMQLRKSEKVPTTAAASIRAKTLFGEKFVDIDPGAGERTGPFFRDNSEIKKTTGGFELEKILSDLEPILKAVNPDEVAVLIDTLARGGEGLGPEINRQIAAFRLSADINAKHDADTQQFLDDLAKLSGALADRAGDLVAGAKDLNQALPDLNARGDQLTQVLDQAARLSQDLADVLDANRPFLDKSNTDGAKTIQLLYDLRGQVPPLVRGLTEFFQVLGEAATAFDDPSRPGTTMAAVKFVAGGGPPCGRPPATCTGTAATSAGTSTAPAPLGPSRLPTLPVPQLPLHLTGPAALRSLIGGVL
ncbi:MAG: ABC-type transport system involved in resistance to organic solvent periplasmic component-like [Acidimicrobiales bacterium]|jgi:phospholipid/cholesterol/gamma-HCH transport system substrate-binding protein|nr:ABC-type transport system involved in resistance to organic solvent periplasmic component-like [Acidimicrobiales bacterium]